LLRGRGVPAELSRFRRLRQVLTGQTPQAADIPGFTPAAVAVVCVPDPDAILLIRRAERPGDPWSGQMGLPGGRMGGGDPDLLETAVRETSEEVGLDLSRGHLVGVLDDLTPRTVLLPRIMVRPYVFLLESRPPLRPNHEVAAVHWVDLAAFLAPGVYAEWEVQALERSARFPGYRLAEGTVWGMTERILTPFLQVVSRG
jgi:8-oxo-dGTP pyrophosphatase MutT (NUDIX family)